MKHIFFGKFWGCYDSASVNVRPRDSYFDFWLERDKEWFVYLKNRDSAPPEEVTSLWAMSHTLADSYQIVKNTENGRI